MDAGRLYTLSYQLSVSWTGDCFFGATGRSQAATQTINFDQRTVPSGHQQLMFMHADMLLEEHQGARHGRGRFTIYTVLQI